MSLEQSNPLVTVYIPTFNRIELLKRAVESVRNQVYKNLEIIVVDDCSTDGTQEYLVELSKEDERIRYVLKEKNSGACVSRNIAIRNARGKYITGLDDDDYFGEKRIEIFIKKTYIYDMNKTVLFSNYEIINKKSTIKKILKKILNRNNFKNKDLIFNNYIGNQVFVTTLKMQEINGFDEKIEMWQDLECWYRLLSNNVAVRVGEDAYFIDVSHNFGRISLNNRKKLEIAYNYFCEKHQLSEVDSKILKTQFIHYGFTDIDLIFLINKIFISKNIWDLTQLMKLLMLKFKKVKE